MFNVKFSIAAFVAGAAVAVMVPPKNEFRSDFAWRFAFGLGTLFDAKQLVLPQAFKGFCPLMERADGLGVRAIKHLTSFAPGLDQADVAQHAKVLGDGGLFEAQASDDRPHRTFLWGQEAENRAAARLGNGVEGVGGGGGSWHGSYNTFPYGNMSSTFFVKINSGEHWQEARLWAEAERSASALGFAQSKKGGPLQECAGPFEAE
jgi:hypothetical protein